MSLPTRKILIVDDSPEDRETWRRYLAGDVATRYVFVERASVESALAACRTEAPEGAPEAGTVSWSVLLVEDHADSARVLITLMRRRGYRVFHASTVAEATALYRSEPVDVIVSDLGLPDGNGLDLIKHLQSVRPVPSIVLSGYGEPDAMADSLGAGVQEHLTKPVEWPRLEAALQRVLLARP